MDAQLSFFDPHTNTVPHTECKIIPMPGIPVAEQPPRKTNYRKGEEQTVFPIKSRDQLTAMASWLRANADPKYLLAFTFGINLGLRANELLELKCSDIFFPDGRIRYIVGDYTDTTDRISVFQDKVDKRRGLYLNESSFTLSSGITEILATTILTAISFLPVKVDTSKLTPYGRSSNVLLSLAALNRISEHIRYGKRLDTFITRATTILCSSSGSSAIPAL